MSSKHIPIVLSAMSLLAVSCSGPTGSSRSIRNLPSSLNSFAGISDYQIGSEWGKTIVKPTDLESQTDVFQRAAKATARVRLGFSGATGFLLGEKNGKVVMATNHHVIEDESVCSSARISFEMLGVANLRCAEILVTSTDLDVTIFTLSGLSASDKEKILPFARSFENSEPRKGTELLTVGYGVAGNPGQRNLMAGQDSDCKTFSPDGESRYMADPDELNPGPYMTWMFATGCDVSHGDSGSALVDRSTGAVVGILSTGKIPKSAVVRDDSYLDRIFAESDEAVWKELTYAVPATKIIELAGEFLP